MWVKILAVAFLVLVGAVVGVFVAGMFGLPSGPVLGLGVETSVPALLGGVIAGFLAWRYV